MKYFILAILFVIVTVSPVFAAYEMVVISKGSVTAAANTFPVITSIAFNGTRISTTQTWWSSTQVPAYQVIGGVETWGYQDGAWSFISSKTDVDRYTGAAYSQLSDIWADNYTYDPALGPPSYQFPNGPTDITNPPQEVPMNLDGAFSFFLGGLTGLGFVMASITRW